MKNLRDAFNVTGLAHILSISGTHFGLFSVLLFGIFRFLIKTFPYRILQRITIFLTPSQAAAILCFPFHACISRTFRCQHPGGKVIYYDKPFPDRDLSLTERVSGLTLFFLQHL